MALGKARAGFRDPLPADSHRPLWLLAALLVVLGVAPRAMRRLLPGRSCGISRDGRSKMGRRAAPSRLSRPVARPPRERVAGPAGIELLPLERTLRGLKERFADAVIDADRNSMREHQVVVPAARLREVAAAVHREWGCVLLTAFALDERAAHGRFRLHYVFSAAPDDAVITLIAAVPADAPRFPSVTPQVQAAHWLEREMQDLLGLVAEGHPDPRPLVAHDGRAVLAPHSRAARRPLAAAPLRVTPVEARGVRDPGGTDPRRIIEPRAPRFVVVASPSSSSTWLG
jgi:Ni,Fe-hydrogenase III component G